ncbi:tyrosine-protein phosphatase [Enterococcus faecalis]
MQSITNFRDLGGIKNKAGKAVKPRSFLRSGELSKLSQEQSLQLKKSFHLGKIIDFRSTKEAKERPDAAVPETKYVQIDILENIHDEGASIEDFIQLGSPERAHEYMAKLYGEITLDSVAQKGYRDFFEEILTLDDDSSLLFHCFAGKDRTGIGAALILETLAVPKPAIYTDYLLTNQLRQQENQALLQQAKAAGLQAEHLQALAVALDVDSSYLDAFYQTVNDHYGSVDKYLTDALQLDQDSRQMLQHRFLTE